MFLIISAIQANGSQSSSTNPCIITIKEILILPKHLSAKNRQELEAMVMDLNNLTTDVKALIANPEGLDVEQLRYLLGIVTTVHDKFIEGIKVNNQLIVNNIAIAEKSKSLTIKDKATMEIESIKSYLIGINDLEEKYLTLQQQLIHYISEAQTSDRRSPLEIHRILH
jgi:hypothetical protein